MSSTNINIKYLMLVCLLANGLDASSQDTTLNFTPYKFSFDSIRLNTIYTRYLGSSSYCMDHSPSKKDNQRYKLYKYLIGQQPTANNYDKYFLLACSLWQLDKTAEAEKMFLAIVNSKAKFYSSTYYHSSDVPGDKSTNKYGYGSFTSNYKNYSAIYLTKIYLEQKKFDEALLFLDDAVHKYKATYSCGTGFRMQQDEYEFLYASCYRGLNRNKEVIDLLLPSCLERNDEMIVEAIKKTYSQAEIDENLKKAENLMECVLDTFPSYTYLIHDWGTKKEKEDTIQYFSGSATIMLFGKEISMPSPNLEDGEHATREMFLKIFRESDFYIKLKESS
jgi:hypothetical protein